MVTAYLLVRSIPKMKILECNSIISISTRQAMILEQANQLISLSKLVSYHVTSHIAWHCRQHYSYTLNSTLSGYKDASEMAPVVDFVKVNIDPAELPGVLRKELEDPEFRHAHIGN
jgi:hypothetical protein